MTNYSKGYNFENQIVKEIRNRPDVLLVGRFHKSVGPHWKKDYDRIEKRGRGNNQDYAPKYAPVDIWWLTNEGMNFAQNKKGYDISTEEMLELLEFAWYVKDSADVYLITKKKRSVFQWKLSNKIA